MSGRHRRRIRVLGGLVAALVGIVLGTAEVWAQEYPIRPIGPRSIPVAPARPGELAQVVPPARAPRLMKAPYRGPVDIRMMVIHANNVTPGYDKEIVHLREHLEFINYKGFRLLFRNDMMLMPQTTRSIGLFDGKVIEVTLTSATQEKANLRVRMFNPKEPGGVALDTSLSVARKGTFFIGGPRYQGGVLLLPITAWY